ncbi:MAG: low-specificity L-threonine aldolase [Anaerolineae bacterium]|nr:low-specificity L-threonine aldolase [Anaerolineae bacterium]NIN94610.1 low-specificity L-threonine aldolase [Anaerolineae bacterium]NIQ77666.1 low-specificity L-threonine aldolase [Anaerolineae bacterium]
MEQEATVKIIDLRSDTVTKPTPAMREAMYTAEVGDDVYGEDPTVNRLEALAAEKLGKEAALFVASGTMGNLVSILTHCRRGDEVIMGDRSHTFLFEVGAASAFAGVQVHILPNERNGMLAPEAVLAAIRGADIHLPPTRLVCVENTHNRCGGCALSPSQMDSICTPVRERGISVHLDGARIFNAAVAQGVDVKELTRNVDSVMFCLSKGLSAPVGSLVAGSEEFIRRARKNRKMLGGGMRQAGIIAAAGIVALNEMVDRLAEDHANARLLAEGLKEINGLDVDLDTVQTDIVIFSLVTEKKTPSEVVGGLAEDGVKVGFIGNRQFRAITHYGIEEADIRVALDAFRRVMEGGA